MQLNQKNKKLLWFAYFAFIAVWSISAYSLVFTWMSEGTLFARYVGGKPTVLDYLLFYEDASLALTAKEKGTNIYDPQTQSAGIAKLMSPVVPETPFYSHYPPPLFAFVIPFGLIPINWSFVVWNILGVGLTLASILPFAYQRFGKTFPFAFITTAIFCSFPVWNCFELGQSSFFLLAGMALFFWLIRREKYFLAGLSVLCLMIKVQYLPYVGIIGLVLGRFKFAAGALLGVILTVAISVLTLGWDNCVEWPRIVLSGETSDINKLLIAPDHMQNIRGMLNLIVGDDTSMVRLISAGLCILSILLVGYLWTKPYNRVRATKYGTEVLIAISLMLMLLFSVHTHVHDYCLFIWAAVLCYIADDAKTERTSAADSLRKLVIAYPIIGWILFVLKPIAMNFLHVQLLALYLCAVLILATQTLLLPALRKT